MESYVQFVMDRLIWDIALYHGVYMVTESSYEVYIVPICSNTMDAKGFELGEKQDFLNVESKIP